MSRPRGNSHQRELVAAAREVLEGAGWTCTLDFAQRGGTQTLIATKGKAERRLQIHGTPRSEGNAIRKMQSLCRRIVRTAGDV